MKANQQTDARGVLIRRPSRASIASLCAATGLDVGYRPYEEEAGGLVQNAFQSMHILINDRRARPEIAKSIAQRAARQ